MPVSAFEIQSRFSDYNWQNFETADFSRRDFEMGLKRYLSG